MKIKVRPEDFYVEEKVNFSLKDKGKFALYRLEKKYWNTLDLLRYLQRRYKFRRFQRLGLKDRYSHSVQYLANPWVKKSPILEKNFSLQFLGFIDERLKSQDLLGNEFKITLRDLKREEGERILAGLALVKEYGFPNFYDEQRLGSARHREGFFAKSLILGEYESALKLYLATPSPYDEGRVRRFKVFMRENWKDWEKGKGFAPKEYKPVLDYLSEKKNDFKGAIKKIERDLLELFVNAYQGYIWNETLNQILKKMDLELFPFRYWFGELYFYKTLLLEKRDYLERLQIPSLSPKSEFSEGLKEVLLKVLEREGLGLEKLKLKLATKGLFFKPYLRKAIVIPKRLEASQLEKDEIYEGKFKLVLSFFLPSGAYATILIKRLTL